MSLSNDIPTKLRVPAQLALDAKSVVTTLSQLETLGTNNNLAYTYYKGMTVLCSENLEEYMWRPVNEGETGGTLPSNFTYPAGIVSEDGVVYSNIAYNFFKETTLTVENLTELVQINNVGEGEDIYAGIDGIGRRKIKRVNTDSNILTITPNTDDITFSIDETALNTFIEANQKAYSADNSVIIEQIPNVGINFTINQTWLQSWLLLNQSVICEITNNCSPPLFAVNDNFKTTISVLTSNSYEIEVLNNDNLGTLPTNIINVSEISPITTGLSLSIAPDNQSIFINVTIPGYILNSGQIYSFTYTIQDATLATSTATVYFEDNS